MEHIAIMGLGLMGGSLGLALKAKGYRGHISAYARREETRAFALAQGMVDAAYPDPVKAVQGADVAVYCTPILTIPALIESSRPGMKKGLLVTDVGSTKEALTNEIDLLLQGTEVTFIGSHPLAGSEQQGIESARAHLYQGARVVLTPSDEQQVLPAFDGLKKLWESVGARISVMSAEEHDRIVARTSHLPHLAAAMLAATTGRAEDPEKWGLLCGTGFRDTSRIAEGSPDVWHDIVRSNAGPVLHELKAFRIVLDDWIDALAKNDFDKCRGLLEKSRDARRGLMVHSPASREQDT